MTLKEIPFDMLKPLPEKTTPRSVEFNANDPDLLMNLLNEEKRREREEAERQAEIERFVKKQRARQAAEKARRAKMAKKFKIGLAIFTVVSLIIAIIGFTMNIPKNETVQMANEIMQASRQVETKLMEAPAEPLKYAEVKMVEETTPDPEPEYELVEYDLPSKYYGDIDFSQFQPYMDYRMITDETSPAYATCYSCNAYTDENGFRRMAVIDGYKVNDQDDYVIALGTYYNEHMTTGSRWLIVTTNGSYTATVGDEKQDIHTDKFNMFGLHGENGEIAGMIEWIVDTRYIDQAIKNTGSVTAGSNPVLSGEIVNIYRIVDNKEVKAV